MTTSHSLNGDSVHGLLIDGEHRPGGGEILDVINPATGQVFARCHSASAEDTDGAVVSARKAFDSGVWSQMPIHQRSRILNRFGDLLERDMDKLYRLETDNNGRPITETKAQITRLAEWYRYNAALLLASRDSVVPMSGAVPLLHLALPARRGGDVVVVQPPADDRVEECGAGVGDGEQRGAQAF